MKYKVGDKVKIKNWKKMQKECNILGDFKIICPGSYHFIRKKEKELNEKFPNRIVTIKRIKEGGKEEYYMMEGLSGEWHWTDYMIEKKIEISKIISLFPTNKRFKLMDLED